MVSLANTGEVLSASNWPGNRPSHDGAAAEVDRALRVCLDGGFRKVLLRGDTDFSQTKHLDRWAADRACVSFSVWMRTSAKHILADDLPAPGMASARTTACHEVRTAPMARPEPRQGTDQRGARQFENIRLESEEVAETFYRPTALRLRIPSGDQKCKNLAIEKGTQRLFDDYRYFHYPSNEWEKSPVAIVFGRQRTLQPREPERPAQGCGAGHVLTRLWTLWRAIGRTW